MITGRGIMHAAGNRLNNIVGGLRSSGRFKSYDSTSQNGRSTLVELRIVRNLSADRQLIIVKAVVRALLDAYALTLTEQHLI